MNYLEIVNECMVYSFSVSYIMLIRDQNQIIEPEDTDDGIL